MLVETANSTPRHKCITFFSFTRVSDSVNSLKFSTMWIKFHKSLQSLWCEGGVCPLDWVVPWLGCPLSSPIKGESEAEVRVLSSKSQAFWISRVVRGQHLEDRESCIDQSSKQASSGECSLLAWRVSIERSALIFMGISLCVICCFSLAAFSIFFVFDLH